MGERLLNSKPDTMKGRKYWSVIILAVIVQEISTSVSETNIYGNLTKRFDRATISSLDFLYNVQIDSKALYLC